MNYSRLIYISILVFTIATFGACNSDKEQVLSRDKMVEVLHDIQLSEAMFQLKYNDFNTREAKDAVINDVLKKHNITQSQLDSSLVWYSDNAEIYMRVNDSVISSLRSEIRDIESQLKDRTFVTYNRNNSIIANHIFLSESAPVLTFSIDSVQVTNYSNFNLEFKTLGFPTDITADFSVYYTYSDTVIVDIQSVNNETSLYGSSNSLTNHTLKAISGYIYVNPSKIGDRKVLLYDITLKNKEE
jgi:hypothetical protein